MAAAPEENGYELCIMRHGIAADRGVTSSDSKRPLTPEGKERMREIAQGLAKTGFTPDRIMTSPYLRAAETAAIIAESAGNGLRAEPCEALEPGGESGTLFAVLARQPSSKSVLVVGHEPDVSKLAASLLGAGRNHDFAFKKGGCCLIALDGFPPSGPGRLLWWLTPRILRKLA